MKSRRSELPHPKASEDVPDVPETAEALVSTIDCLQKQIQALQEQVSRLQLQPQPASTPATSLTSSDIQHSSSIKLSHLPKFHGRVNESIDDWIEKITAIKNFSRIQDKELLVYLPMLLLDSASHWFFALAPQKQINWTTWDDWTEALRGAFRPPNYQSSIIRQSLDRTLKATESASEYFYDKCRLLRQARPDMPEKVMMDYILEGIFRHYRMLVSTHITQNTDLEELRRILIEFEPLCRRSPQVFFKDSLEPPTSIPMSRNQPTSTPPSPCPNCNGPHWKRDCTAAAFESKDRYPSSTPLHKRRSFTPHQSSSSRQPDRRIVYHTQVLSQKALSDSCKNEIAHPEQVSDSRTLLKQPFAASLKPEPDDPSVVIVPLSRSICSAASFPAYVQAKIGSIPLSLCIDTGSSISLIDSKLVSRLEEPFASRAVQSAPNYTIESLSGQKQPEGSIKLPVSFETTQGEPITFDVLFITVPHINGKAIIGMDMLLKHSANISIALKTLTFENHPKTAIPLSNIPLHSDTPVATKHCYFQTTYPIPKCYATAAKNATVHPFHRTRLPITVSNPPSAKLLMVEPMITNHPEDLTRASYSIIDLNNATHYIDFINAGPNTATVRKGEKLGSISILTSPTTQLCQSIETNKGKYEGAVCAFPLGQIDINSSLTEGQKSQVQQLILSRLTAFSQNSTSIGCTSRIQMNIDTSASSPISLAPYRASPREKVIIEEQLNELEKQNIIEDSHSPWAAPIVLVRKKNGDIRVCIDYRRINSVTKSDQYPIPRIDDILAHLSGKQWVSAFDTNKGFYQVPLATNADKEKTAFRTHLGLKQFTRMPFGLKNGPATFQRLMDRVLGEHKWQIALVYIDDLLIYSDTFEDHLKHCGIVLDLIIKSGLTLNLSKAHLFYQELHALGHKISNLGLGTDEEKVRIIAEWPAPKNTKELQRFLGLATYYRKFIRNFATIAAPLTRLLQQKVIFNWTSVEQNAFEQLKNALTSAPILVQPDYTHPFRLYTDASRIGLGAILAQTQIDGSERVICYLSRSLKPEEKNYSATELECLAIVWSLKKLHVFVDGSKLELVTDHSALQWLYDFKGTNRRILKWALEVQPYRDDMSIIHRPGKLHSNVDALSRQPQVNLLLTTPTISHSLRQQLIDGYLSDAFFKDIYSKLTKQGNLVSENLNPSMPHRFQNFTIHDNLLYLVDPSDKELRLCVPQVAQLRQDILFELHDTPTSGHLGFDKTYYQIRKRYYWPKLSRDVKQHVKSCYSCQVNKTTNGLPLGHLNPLPIPGTPWQHIAMDFITGLPRTITGYDSIMSVTDRFTKRGHFIPTHATVTAPEVAKLFIEHVFRHHGLPKSIVSDRDSKFTSNFWTDLFNRLQTKLCFSTAFHPQTDGQTERLNRTIIEMIRHYINANGNDWDTHLPVLEFSYNNSIHPSTTFTPFRLDTGHDPVTPMDIAFPSIPVKNEAAHVFIETLNTNFKIAQEAILQSQIRQKKYHDRNRSNITFSINDLVLLSTAHIKTPTITSSRKLHSRYIGPFRIIDKISDNAYHLDLPVHIPIHPVINIEHLKKFTPPLSDYISSKYNRPQPVFFNDKGVPEYEVEQILKSRTRNKKREYLVKWSGYPEFESTWEPEEHLSNAKQVLEEFLSINTKSDSGIGPDLAPGKL